MHDHTATGAQASDAVLGAPSAPRTAPTIREVARVAGVSYGTVSRYLNGHKWVGEDTAVAIRAAIAATGYRPNRAARSLATGRSSTVVFLLPESQNRLFADPVNSVLLQQLSEAALDRGLALVLMTAGTEKERSAVVDFINGGSIEGVLLVSPRGGDPIIDSLVRSGVRVVSCGRPLGWEDSISSVSADDFEGSRLATAELIARGRRHLTMIAGPGDSGGAIDRLDGFKRALADASLPFDPSMVVEGDWSHSGGREAMTALLDTTPLLDGVVAANDMMASGALVTLRAAGRIVPDDVAVVGFDDTGQAATLDPPLTTIRQPFSTISREMLRLLLDQEADGATTLTVPGTLVVRGSTPDA